MSLTFEETLHLIETFEKAGYEIKDEYSPYNNKVAMVIANTIGSEGDRNSRIAANLLAQYLFFAINLAKV